MPSRLETFRRFWTQQLAIHDCDPGIYAVKYLVRRQELNVSQQFWLCWLYACTYNVATAWVIFNEFPDYENVDVERLAAFDRSNKGRLPYQKDQKWLRGHLAPMYSSLREQCGDNLDAYWARHYGDFKSAWKAVMSLHKVGRYTAWMFLQAMHEVCQLEIEPDTLELNHDSSQMHRGGLCLALGLDDWAEKGRKFSAAELAQLELQATCLLVDVQDNFKDLTVIRPNFYSMETALCAFRKLFRRDRGRYLGYYLDRWADDIKATSAKDWPGIDWELLWECRLDGLPKYFCRSTGVDKSQFSVFLDSGEKEFMAPCAISFQLDHWYRQHPTSLL